MAQIPYAEPMNVYKMYAGLGDTISGGLQNLAVGVNDWQQERKKTDYIKRLYEDVNKSTGMNLQPIEGETREAAESRLYGNGILSAYLKTLKKEDRDFVTPDLSNFDIRSTEQAKFAINELDGKLKNLKQSKARGIMQSEVQNLPATGTSEDIYNAATTKGLTGDMPLAELEAMAKSRATTKTLLGDNPRPMTEGAAANLAMDQAKFQRQLEQDYEDAVVKLTNVTQDEKNAWNEKKKAESEREKWIKSTETGEGVYLKSKDDKMKADIARLDKVARDIMNKKTTLELNTQRVKEKAKLAKKDIEKNQPKKKDLNAIF